MTDSSLPTALDRTPLRSGHATADGVSPYYEVHGEGPPLVLLHGGAQTIDLAWRTALPALAAEHQVVAVELQGHGHTADTDRPMSLAAYADDVVAVLDELGAEKADWMGFSLGALTTLEACVRHPGRVRRAVVCSGHTKADGYHDWVMGTDMEAGETHPGLPTPEDFAEMQAAYAAVAPDPDHFFAFLGKQSAMVAAFEGWTDEQLQDVEAEVLLVVGDQDFVRLDHALDTHARLPGSQLCVLPGTTHMGVSTHPCLPHLANRFLAAPDPT